MQAQACSTYLSVCLFCVRYCQLQVIAGSGERLRQVSTGDHRRLPVRIKIASFWWNQPAMVEGVGFEPT